METGFYACRFHHPVENPIKNVENLLVSGNRRALSYQTYAILWYVSV